jgi:CzcA family heavy metal efflux pump
MRVTGLQAAVIRLALQYPVVVVTLFCLLVGYGIYSLDHASYDAFPEFAPPQVDIQTEAPGYASAQVETLVTRPVETAINGVTELRRTTSTSIPGLSDIKVYFDPATDPYRARQLVAERLTTAVSELPSGAGPPRMTPLTSSMATVLVVGLTSPSLSLMRLRTIAEWTIRPRLLSVPGVAGVEIFGGQQQSTQIRVHPNRLVRFDLGWNDVLAAARDAVGVRGAGFVSTPNQRITLQTELSTRPAAIARTVVTRRAGANVTLGDIADVIEAPEPAVGAGAIRGEPGVVMNIDEQYGANTLAVTRALEQALAELRPSLAREGAVLHGRLFRPANFITVAIDNLYSALLIGAALVVAVLFLFLFHLRTAAICGTAIPISLLAAVIVAQYFGVTLNAMTLGGLAIALGEVVDDAVIGVENITRRLRENTRLEPPRPPARVILEATFEVRSAVVYATFAVILVFLPVVTLSGVAGRLFAPLGITYILAVLASLVVALTATPALSLLLLPQRMHEREPPVLHWTRRRYETVLKRVVPRPGRAVAAALGVTVGAFALLPMFGATFLPELQEGHFIVHMSAIPGTSLEESLRMGARVTARLAKLPIVGSVAQRVGRAELAAAGDTHGPHQSEFEVELRSLPRAAGASAKTEILRQLANFPGVNISANTFLAERVDETFSGYTTPIAVNVYGNDLGIIENTAQNIAKVLRGVSGAASVQVQAPSGLPQLTIRLRSPDLLRWGLDPVQVLDLVRAAYQGEVAGQTYEGDRVFDVVVTLAQAPEDAVTRVEKLLIRAPDGTYVALDQLADIAEVSGPYEIQHQGGRRVQSVTLDVGGRDLASFVRDARRTIAARVALPKGTYVEFSGAAEAQAAAQRDLIRKSLFAGVGIVLLLSIVTRHWRNLLLTMANLPFALAGGIIAAFLSGGVLSLGTLVGFVTLFGITLRNAMMMIAHYEHLVAVDGLSWSEETAIRGAADRLAAVVMTSLVTGLGLLPLAVGMNAPGREIEGPMALVILGGLGTSAALNLLILPILAARYGRFEPAARKPGSAKEVAS